MHTILLTLLFTYVSSPFVPMKENPDAKSKVVSQALYSEPVEIIQEKQNWALIKTPDNYTGWVEKSALHATDQQYPNTKSTVAKVNRCAAHVYGVADTEFGPIITLPYESKVEIVDDFGNPNGRWMKIRLVDDSLAFIQNGDIEVNPKVLTMDEMLVNCHRFLGLPYTWGGRSSFGYDCSGFIQMNYRQMGIALPRDSKDQANWDGFKQIAISDLKPGELIFFGRVIPTVTHVGMYLGNSQFIHTVGMYLDNSRFIHASVQESKPYLRISSLNDPEWSSTGPFNYRLARTLK